MHRIARWMLRVSRTQRIAFRAGRCASAARNASHPKLDAARQPRAMHRIPRSTPHVSRTQCIASHARRRTSAARNTSHPTLDAARQPHATHLIPRSTPRVSRTQHIPSHARRRASAARVSRTQHIPSHARRRASAAHNTSHPTLDAARSAGGTRGEALVLSDNRTAPFGCALMTARLLRVDDGARAALQLRVAHAAPDFVSHSTLHRKSRSPRQRARGLRPCVPPGPSVRRLVWGMHCTRRPGAQHCKPARTLRVSCTRSIACALDVTREPHAQHNIRAGQRA